MLLVCPPSISGVFLCSISEKKKIPNELTAQACSCEMENMYTQLQLLDPQAEMRPARDDLTLPPQHLHYNLTELKSLES